MAPARASLRKLWHVSAACGILRALLPSFVADAVWPEPQQQKKHKLHPTSYLDGLRGIASVVVFVCHYTELRHGYFLPSYGLNKEGAEARAVRSAFLQLPFVRVLYSGRPMVHIFFVISGFALAYKPLRLLHGCGGNSAGAGADKNNLARCLAALASSALRRPVRLFAPCAVSTLGIAALAQTGRLYAPAPSWPAQLRQWADAYVYGITWPWAWDRDLRPAYDIHLWTIPIEFAHAMLLLVALLALAPLRTRLRRALNALLVAYCAAAGRWAAAEFLAGLFLAERHVLQQARRSASRGGALVLGMRAPPAASRCRLAAPRRWLRAALHGGILAAALFVAGWPNEGAEQTPGIRGLLARTPALFLAHGEGDAYLLAQKFWFGAAAVGVVWSCGALAAARRRLEGGLAQYCGRISFALYLVHGPGLDYFQDRVLGRPAEPARGTPSTDGYAPGTAGAGVKGLIGVATPAQRVATWLAGLLVLAPVVVWLADVFWRAVDAPIVALARTVERACLRPEEEEESSPPERAKERIQDGYATAG